MCLSGIMIIRKYCVRRQDVGSFRRDTMPDIADRLKELRKSKGITQKQVYVAIGLSESNYQSFEYGTYRPSHDSIIKLADFFDVSVDYLLGRTDKPEMNL